MENGTCSVETCERPVRARGWCHTHWGRWKRHGDVQADRPIRPRQPNGTADPVCLVDGCGRPHFARGCCATHHGYLLRGKPLSAMEPVRQAFRPGVECLVDGCLLLSFAAGMCNKHYTRRQRHGTTDLPVRPAKDPDAERERRREYQRQWKAAEYARNRDAVLTRHKAWLANNADRMKLHDARKRMKRRGLVGISVRFTADQLAAKIAYWGSRCWICSGPYEAIDHVKPVTKGGPHMLANIRPICRSCNSRKSNRWPYPPKE